MPLSVAKSKDTPPRLRRPWQLSRARGCMLGHLCGDALGSGVVAQRADSSLNGSSPVVQDMAGGGPFNTMAGQITDASEMALALTRQLAQDGRFDQAAARLAYTEWLDSVPFDCQEAVADALCHAPGANSQSNGALMRATPIGIFGAGHDLGDVGEWADMDASITHLHPICRQASSLFAVAIAYAIESGADSDAVFGFVRDRAISMEPCPELVRAIESMEQDPWIDKSYRMKEWVLVAFQNAFWQLRNSPSLEAGLIDTVARGGDADTNAAICGALLGAVYGIESIPQRWTDSVLGCCPDSGQVDVCQPRPKSFWACDALELVDLIVS